jgi:type VI secretion system secreted protein VgrG
MTMQSTEQAVATLGAELLGGLADSHPSLRFTVGDTALDVRSFSVEEGLSRLFAVELECVSHDVDLDFDALIGQSARFSIDPVAGEGRSYSGIVRSLRQTEPEPNGLSSYVVSLVPELWLLTQTRSYRVFQQLTDPDIAQSILRLWSVNPELRLSAGYKERRYRVQYGESDFAFFCRMLEDAGVTFYFDTSTSGDSALVLDDAPHAAESRGGLPWVSKPNPSLREEYVTAVRVARRVRPGAYTQEDLDYRRPAFEPLSASRSAGLSVEQGLERYHFDPGAFSFKAGGGNTPVADDRGAQRTDLAEGASQVEKRLLAKRGSARTCRFVTSAVDVRPGTTISITGHAKTELGAGATLLVVESTYRGGATSEWHHECNAHLTDQPFYPPLRTPKPRTRGTEAATVVGPAGEEIHTDELGRVRVQFHWDLNGHRDDSSSLWVPVSQPWGGAEFGALNIPRIGQEVLVDFLGADADRPVVIGRVFTATAPVPYELPKYANLQAIRSQSTPSLGDVPRSGVIDGATAGGGGDPGEASPQTSPLGGGLPMSLDQIAKLLKSSPFFKALSPDESVHGWQGSELAMHDDQGNEKVYLQAQKDMHAVVKNQHKGVVGNARSQVVGSDRVRDVGNKEVFNVGSDRVGYVGNDESLKVEGDVIQVSMTGGQDFSSAETFRIHSKEVVLDAEEGTMSRANRHYFNATETIILVCGDSMIAMFPDAIVVEGTDVLINPGQDAADAILFGKSVGQQIADDAAAADLAAAEAKKAADEAREQQLAPYKEDLRRTVQQFWGDTPYNEIPTDQLAPQYEAWAQGEWGPEAQEAWADLQGIPR